MQLNYLIYGSNICQINQMHVYSSCTCWFAQCLIHLILLGLFKQYHVLLPIMNHSSRLWSIQPVLDCFHLYMIHSTCIQPIHPILAWYNQYLIILSCIQYVWGCFPSIQHVLGLCDRYWSHKSRNWAAFAICQVYRDLSMTVTILSHAFNSFDLYLIESYSISWILPLLDWFDLCLICATWIRLLPPYLDHSNSIWWFQQHCWI